MYDVFITTNGPGEISAWVKPFVKQLKIRFPEVRISLFIMPCRFSTGTEEEVALGIDEIDYVFRAKDFEKRLKALPFKHYKKGMVVFLGGDLLGAVMLKIRYGYKAIAYTEGEKSWKWFFNGFYLRDKDGDLMFSSLVNSEIDHKFIEEHSRKKNIVFFPGSRPEQFKYLFPLMQKAALLLPKKYNCLFNISAFIPDDQLNELKDKDSVVIRDKNIELMKVASLAVTIPGTNNMQLAYFNVPALIVFPFNYPEAVQFKGLLGAILNLPILRIHGKRWVLKTMNKKVKFTSLVNTKENKLIYPELRGEIHEANIANSIEKILSSHDLIYSIQENLKKIDKGYNVLNTMIDKILCYAKK